MKNFKNIMSFLYPMKIESRTGSLTPYLEVIKFQGKQELNSLTVNYSFGGLHKIFEQLFKKIDIEKFDFKNVLILGMGAGSIVSLLEKKHKINCHITAVEKDEVVIELAKKYFNIDEYKSLTIIQEDAFEYVCRTKEKYDLIISDLFIESDVPEKFKSNEYLVNLKRISKDSCCIIYNKMTYLQNHKKELTELFKKFELIFPGATIYKLYTFSAENSLIYYNTLPIGIKKTNSVLKNEQKQKAVAPNFKPSFS